ncbi:MAG: hypothetical protein AAF582_03200 [Pseudomonadota bacterium]
MMWFGWGNWIKTIWAATLAGLAASGLVSAQIIVDQPVRAGGLWCLPDSHDPNLFRYLPEDARIARDPSGRPLFSLTYYNAPAAAGDEQSSIGQADGGALLTMFVEYATPRARIARAAAALTELVHPDAVLAGPVVFDDGTYGVISASVADARTAFSSGPAPVLENGRVAISIQLDRDQAAILFAALQADTPDLSVVFDMTYSGVRASYAADILIDWDKASDSLDRGVSASVSVYGVGVGGDIEEAVTELMTDGAITVEVAGEDAAMDAIVTHIQELATKLFFTPIEDSDAAEDFGKWSDVGGVDASAGQGTNRYFSLNAKVKYKRKAFATTGTSRISLRKAGPATRRWSIVFNASEVSANLRDNPDFVRTVDLTDNAIIERQIDVTLDASLRAEFGDLVDSVNVELRKTHVDGRETFRYVTLTADDLTSDVPQTLGYPKFGPEPWDEWLQYEARQEWVLKGLPSYHTAWHPQRSAQMILSAPFRRAEIQPLGDMGALEARGARAVIIEVTYPFLGGDRTERASALPRNGGFDPFEIVAPNEDVEFQYVVTQIFPPDRRVQCESADRSGFVIFDAETCGPEG